MNSEPVVVDTNVFSAALSRDQLASAYSKHLSGRRLIISFQTVAEMRYGALAAGWGEDRRRELERTIARAARIPPHDRLATEWAELRAACHDTGHALAAATHRADLWIAATARLIGVPLVTHDRIFFDAPGLQVISELAR